MWSTAGCIGLLCPARGLPQFIEQALVLLARDLTPRIAALCHLQRIALLLTVAPRQPCHPAGEGHQSEHDGGPEEQHPE